MFWTIFLGYWRIYLGLALIASSFYGGWAVNGWRLEKDLDALKTEYAQAQAEALAKTVEREHIWQAKADDIKRDKDEQIQSINDKLTVAIKQLQNRPTRSSVSSTTVSQDGKVEQGCDGSKLYREDSEFLIREAARADTINTALMACYKQYDSLLVTK